MSKVQLFKDLKKMFKSSMKKMKILTVIHRKTKVIHREIFFYESLWSKFSIFSLAVIFSKFVDGIKEKALKHQKR